MSTQSIDSDTENPSDEEPSTGPAYAELLATSSFEELEEKPWEVKLALLQHHLQLARIFVEELLEEEVEQKAGERHSHDDRRFSRWGSNPGSVRIGEEKVPIKVPRMVDTETEKTFSPERYYQMKELPAMSEKMQEAILLGLSQNDYERGDRRGTWSQFRRMIYTRIRRKEGQRKLSFARKDTVIYTNLGRGGPIDRRLAEAGKSSLLQAESIVETHHGRGQDELVHRALKDFGTERMPFEGFFQNMAFYSMMLLSFNLYEAFKEDAFGAEGTEGSEARISLSCYSRQLSGFAER